MTEFLEKATELLIKREAIRLKPYRWPAGKLTIGIGRNLEDKGISRAEAIFLCENDILDAIEDLNDIFGPLSSNELTEARQLVLVDMRFNLGPGGFRTFKKMIAAVKVGDWEEAAAQMKDSAYFKQVGSRGLRLYNMMKGITA